MRIVAFAALVGAVKAGLTQSGLDCGVGPAADPATADSDLCGYADIAATIAAEVDGTGGGKTANAACTTAAECPCWGSFEFGTEPYSKMVAENSADEIELAAALTALTPKAAAAITVPCGLSDQGPVVITKENYDMSGGFDLETGNWCGKWSDREVKNTCAYSIFDKKGLLFLIIIGGALAIIFFECSVMAVVAATQGKKKAGDAKP
eukprot:COSAG06_NODE_4403_length_4293_cov_27.038251_5_plen_207_part_00